MLRLAVSDSYRLARLAWHEAGHIVASEFLAIPWHDASIDRITLCGAVRASPSAGGAAWPREQIGLSPGLQALAQRLATMRYAGRAAELLLAAEEPHAERFAMPGTPDFEAAESILRCAGHTEAARFCQLMAWEICTLRRTRIARLARLFLARGVLLASQVGEASDGGE